MSLKKHTKKYTTISTTILRNPLLSWKAKGLWAFLNSKPENWHFSIERIAHESNDGVKATASGLKELKNAGLLLTIRTKTDDGTFSGNEYHLFDDAAENKAYIHNAENGEWINGEWINGECKTGEYSNIDISKPVISKKEGVRETTPQKTEKEKNISENFNSFDYSQPLPETNIQETDDAGAPALPFGAHETEQETQQPHQQQVQLHEIISYLIKVFPLLEGSIYVQQIAYAVRQRNEHWQEYVQFVKQCKADRYQEIKGWKYWFWDDFLMERAKPPKQQKFVTITDEEEKEIEFLIKKYA